jgi:tetratricopeptide (TPR) repeat protein
MHRPGVPVLSRRAAVNTLALGVLLLLLAAVLAGRTSTAQSSGTTAAGPDAPRAPDSLSAAVAAAQRRLTDTPGDWRTWAQLGAAYVERARLTADPSYYAKAEGALRRSLDLRPDGNDLALTGLGALANARHDFRAAAELAVRALAVNSYSAVAEGVLADARTQLGDYPAATEAVQRMLELRPGVASFTRASYDAELHGDLATARSALEQVVDIASGADEAYARTYLGGLAFSVGDLGGAEAQYELGRAVLPDDPALRWGEARVAAARGDVDTALAAFQAVVDVRPLPEYFVEYGEYLESLGREDEAQEQFALVETIRKLFVANGVTDDLGVALFAADHGDAATAVRAARAEFARRQNVDAQDALGWALHSAGRDDEALVHARAATALGGRNALFLFHRGAIEAALGRTDEARRTLAAALDTNPYFSSLLAPQAEKLLASLGGRP